jgi:hypothetical protein
LTTPTQPVRSAPLLAVIAVVLAALPARAINEIQVSNAEIAPVGTFTLQQDPNYVQNGSRTLRQDQSGVAVLASPLTAGQPALFRHRPLRRIDTTSLTAIGP